MSNSALLSKDGKRNSYFVHCRVHQQSRPYAMCLHHADRVAGGGTSVLYNDCDRAISGSTCQALAMHREELEKAQPIYFLERNKLPIEPTPAVGGIGMAIVTADANDQKAAPTVAKPAPHVPADSGYAAAINAAMREHRAASAAPAPTPSIPVAPAAPKPPALPGETPLAYARRIQSLTQGTPA
ncbi:hypothetical protein [Cupriavidus metallidurans]|uniref:hypothetical protein n=1 Tax=Cupriavidus metallidurans TaxID=119219 RepID=UPI001CCD74B0|nr:hypothetical protein [Cupriavidus metallidurans]UBM12735.1 hypothetical protein LAI70_28390 [Cupriavidus metallidurans]